MKKPLLIVESPTKVKTLKKYVGKDYNVTATVGHIRDLPPKELGIDIEDDFKPKYITIQGKTKVIQAMKSAAGDTDTVYLAPDPDREGEAIAFHAAEVLKKKGRTFYRVLFHELTQKGISEALENPLDLNHDRYEAQQTRRSLDRLVGYQISPLLWRRVQGGLSAGRVQSVAVRIICDRERIIRAFEPEEYWTITADLATDLPPTFTAALARIDNKKAVIPDQQTAEKIVGELENAAFVVEKIVSRTIKRNPLPPFITSKLQQDAINRLRFTAKKTMLVAQQLYEGIEIGTGGPEGLITYMRTDSIRIADEAAQEALEHIRQTFGPEYALATPRFFKNKNKAQDAHEAIRPTSVLNTPERLKSFLGEDQFKLYELIWNRFVASQMAQAIIDQNTISIQALNYTFTVGGTTVKFPGFMALYAAIDEKADKAKQKLPIIEQGMGLERKAIIPKQHFTKPPPRFSEASLVKELEENGIGRPSTYASILSIIRDKGYVELINRYFVPSELGFIVNDLLMTSFPEILDTDFTARMENDLDEIESGTKHSLGVLKAFYSTFKEKLDHAKENMLSVKGVGIPTGLSCPLCGKPLNIKMGRNGHFIACTGYPECSFSSNYTRDEKGAIQILETKTDNTKVKDCIKCGSPMVKKEGRFGEFLACTGYPECKHTESVNGDAGGRETGAKCPEPLCNGVIVEKRSRRGKTFFGCNKYPECTFASWDPVVNKPCPKCNSSYLIEKQTKKEGKFLKCPNKECTYKESLDD
ncbi:TopA [Desulforapulum autotrophicum HRM2]|uniref:DNA topoisomerase 1 n=1 Tax=Desulforapulum autotrophicum (strain ATCC 43914 / DSM 3382 / VKM B-1955 / HRM2) TaxID=177437 RepID=C0QI83_DESAH|nr:type I DNA topoisomerase [Desulforapulum autotrophicum]ACN15819.1 TopA [Desulforapulum autotrophicum HRM2]